MININSKILSALGLALAASLLPVTALAADAQPTLTIGVVGGLTGVSTSSNDSVQSSGLSSKRKFGLGGSVFFDTPIANALSLAVGGIYVQRTFEIGNDTLRIERKVPTLFVPVEAHFWLQNFLYVGGGVFGAFRVGDQKDSILSGSSTVFSFSSNQRESVEYGLSATAGVAFPFQERTGLTVEGRYLHGISNASKDALYNEEIRDLVITAGVRITI